jgi:uncharacterized protein (TIGR02646 family)
MIFINRSGIALPDSLAMNNSSGAAERIRVIAHYQNPNVSTYSFKAYKGDDVVEALKKLFKKKCAYCESKITATGPIEVEHFRPKGRVAEDESHIGYWWLASEWLNLLPSCIDCNRERYHSVYSYHADVPIREILTGKKDTFPIAGQRAHTHHDELALEDPLLIDPTVRDPKSHIGWVFERDLPIAVPIFNEGVLDIYGDKSIEVLGLNRSALVEARRDVLHEISVEILRIKQFINTLSKIDKVTLQELLPSLERMLSDLNYRKSTDKEYSAFASVYIDARLKEIEEELIGLF